jgi:hypothetical protein
MAPEFSRRDALKLAGLGLTTAALRPLLPDDGLGAREKYGRVAASRISIFREPSFQSQRTGYRTRDELITLLEKVESPAGPPHNPRWYRVFGGYAHSGYIQPVGHVLQEPAKFMPQSGRVCAVSVPYTLSMRLIRNQGWTPLYRLYYSSQHWVTGVETGPDNSPWYRITDERLRVHYYAPARHLRPLLRREMAPLSPHVPPEQKRLQVSLADQTVTAYEFGKPVFHTRVSTGMPSRGPSPNGIPTDTPPGRFNIASKMPVRHMGDGYLTAEASAYELPGVPWCSFFVSTGVAFHGTYWHDNFGTRMSHGCVNMRNQDAQWLYRWSTPVCSPRDWYRNARGTTVDVA